LVAASRFSNSAWKYSVISVYKLFLIVETSVNILNTFVIYDYDFLGLTYSVENVKYGATKKSKIQRRTSKNE
jgi:hypothetical protein